MASPLRIKICGITTVADALTAAQLGADAIGLNFYPPSPRYIAAQAVLPVLRALPPFVEPVGVFTNVPLPEVIETAQRLGLRTVQCHGDRHEVADAFPFRLVPAFAVRDSASLATITTFLEEARARNQLPTAILVDGHAAGLYGGTGQTAPWRLLADFHPDVPLILAGGLNADNVAEAVRIVRPYAVDVASGVESSPGKKDAEKLRRFIENARVAAG